MTLVTVSIFICYSGWIGAGAVTVTMPLTVRKGLTSWVLSFVLLSPVLFPHFVRHTTFLHVTFSMYELTHSLLLVLDKLAHPNTFYFPVQGNEWDCAGSVGCARDLALDLPQSSIQGIDFQNSASLKWQLEMKHAEGLTRSYFHWGYCCREGVKRKRRIWVSSSYLHLLISLFWSTVWFGAKTCNYTGGEKRGKHCLSFKHKIANLSQVDSRNVKFASVCHEVLNEKKWGLSQFWNPDCVFLTNCEKGLEQRWKASAMLCIVVWLESNLPACSHRSYLGLGELSSLTGLVPETLVVVLLWPCIRNLMLVFLEVIWMLPGWRKEKGAHGSSLCHAGLRK